MTLKEIKQFLRNKPGYLKKSGKSLRNIFLQRGIITTIANCKLAIQEVKEELKDINTKEILEDTKDPKVLIYDIETSFNIGWFWRGGYKQNITPKQIIKERKIICISYKWLGEDQVYNLVWDENQDDKFILENFIPVMNEADLLVAHNGDRFDLKWIKTRALCHRLDMLIDYPQFDTLKVAKKKFLFNHNHLDYISKLLGFDGKYKTDIDLWIDVILKKDKKQLQYMVDYCDEDVRQLEEVYKIIMGWEQPKFHAGVMKGKNKQTSPITGGKNLEHVRSLTTNRGTVKHVMRDLDCNRLFEMSDTNYKKYKLINE